MTARRARRTPVWTGLAPAPVVAVLLVGSVLVASGTAAAGAGA
ncbi:hypothetical protein ACI78Q_18040 [Geodermatophilus sp. SYSU D00705]